MSDKSQYDWDKGNLTVQDLLDQRTTVKLVVFVVVYTQGAWAEVIGVYSDPEQAQRGIAQDLECTGGYKEKYKIMQAIMDDKPDQLREYTP